MQTSLGSAVELEIHTEQAFSNLRPDFLSLACLRGDPNATTFILPVNTILDHISLSEKELLLKPLWKIGVDLSFKLNRAEFIQGDLRGPIPILTSDGYLVFDQDLMRGITEEAEQLRKKIIQIYYDHRTEHCLRPGEIIWIDNRRALHGRSSFSPKFDGKDRFLLRTFITLDLEKSAYARRKEKEKNEERMVRAIFS
jgi:L-asparagine oxygenase